MQKNLFSIKSVLSVAILFFAFSFNANAQALNAETTSNSNAFNPPSAIDYNLFPVELNSNYVPDETQSLLFDNGSVFNITDTPMLSMLQDSSLGMDTYGFGAQISANNYMADDFTLDSDAGLSSVDFYVYQTGATSTSINGVYVQVYDGEPGAGGDVIWGDLTNNVLLNVELLNGYRQLESSPGDTSRRIQKVTADLDGLELEAGTYWIEVSFNGTGASGPWAPPITITGVTTTGNAKQYTGATGTYAPAVDGGIATPQGLPFQIYGEELNLEECTGTPNAGTISGVENICPEAAFTLTAEGMTTGVSGLTRQWQSSPAGENDWSDIAGATSSTYNVLAGIEEATDFRFAVTCTASGETTYTEVHSIELNPSEECYCIPEGTNSSRYINNFSTTGAAQNISNMGTGFSAGGYGDFFETHEVAHIAGQEIEFSVDIMGGTAGFRIWVDWNQNGTFDPSEEVAWNSNGYSSSHSGSFTIPTSALLGETRMRIASHWLSTTGDVDPCATGFTYGEFEDYKFTVMPMEGCSGTPEAGEVTVTPSMGQPGSTYIVSASNYTIASGMTFQWQSNTDGAGWVDEGDATDVYLDYTATAAGEANSEIEWRLAVTCNDSGETSYSETATYTISLYCIPEGTDSSRYISNFSTTGGVDNISNLESGFSDGGYGDFFDTHGASQIQGESVSFESTVEGGTAGFRIWVDWNQDGTFDPSEEVAYSSNGYSSSHTGSFTIPMSALLGETRMRVVSHWLSTTGDVDPCATDFTYGEFEDYKFTVLAMEDCDGTPEGGQVSVDPETGNAGTTYTVSASGYTIGNGLTYQWQSNTDGAGWVDEGEALQYYEAYTATAPDEVDVEVEWRLEVTCNNSNETSYSDTAIFTTVLTYCQPSFSSTSDYITSFELEEIQNLNSGFSPGGYGDFTSMSTYLEDTTYNAILTSSSGSGSHGASIWIDFNDNGTFEASERVGYASGIGPNETVEITIDLTDATLGEHRMRVIYQYNIAGDLINPCVSASFGEAEDYTVIIGEQEPESFLCEDNFVQSNNFEAVSVFGGDTNQRIAIDVVVGDEGFTVYGMDLNILTMGDTDLEFEFNIFEDNDGLPGAAISENIAGIEHSSEYLGTAFGYNVYNYVIAFESEVALSANTNYWIEVVTTGIAWEATNSDTFGAPAAYANDSTSGDWELTSREMVYSLVCEQLGVSDLNSFEFAYYPNPVRDVLNINSQKAVQSVEVYNLTGQRVISESKVNQDQIDVSKLATGTYVFRVTLEGCQVETFKIIKR